MHNTPTERPDETAPQRLNPLARTERATDAVGLDHELAIVKRQIARELFPDQGSGDAPEAREVIGRFVIERRVGAGAMGVVYQARDTTLARRVALKLVRPAYHLGATEQLRLLREAQALASLSHPNVVVVHEAGLYEQQVYLAMEFVEGETLRHWQARARGWRPILDMYIEAGRGLAAAHDAGLVHRDFKPDNVLVGDDGRPRVADFGLVAVDGAPARGEELASTLEDIIDGSPIPSHLTHTRAILGTPVYMAPEQHLGELVDARGDQFSFCVALWEALHDERPFIGDGYEALHGAVLEGRVQAPRRRGIPRAVTRALLRGLAPRPGDRFPTMHELLEALARARVGRRGRWWVVGALVTVGALGAAWLGQRPRAATLETVSAATREPCPTESAMRGAWDDARRSAARAHFEEVLGPERGPRLFARVGASLDDYVAGWRASSDRQCAMAPGEDEALARRLCLGWRRAELEAVTELLLEADPIVASNAEQLLAALTPVTTCSDARALRLAPTRVAAEGSAEAAIDRLIVRAEALWHASAPEEAMRAAAEALARARDEGAGGRAAEASTLAAMIERFGDWRDERPSEETMIHALERASVDAERAGLERVAVRARLLRALHHDGLDARARALDVVAPRVEGLDAPVTTAVYHLARAEVEQWIDPAAVAEHVARARRVLPAGHALNYVTFWTRAGEARRGVTVAQARRALATARAEHEEDAPPVQKAREALAEALLDAGHAIEAYGELIALHEDIVARVGGDDRDAIHARWTLARARDRGGDHEGALEEYERVLADADRLRDPDRARLRLLGAIAEAQARRGDFSAALACSDRARALCERSDVCGANFDVHARGRYLVGAGRPREALALYREYAAELEELSRARPDEPLKRRLHEQLYEAAALKTRLGVAEARLAAAEPGALGELWALAASLSTRASTPSFDAPLHRARVHFALARALEGSDARARDEARAGWRALAGIESAPARALRGQISAWLERQA
ncbi:MAG: serine/threonine protein kinase [Myxococcales bacterium]|nr:serine/threonine protein kinase [Myxococcales bacterium]